MLSISGKDIISFFVNAENRLRRSVTFTTLANQPFTALVKISPLRECF